MISHVGHPSHFLPVSLVLILHHGLIPGIPVSVPVTPYPSLDRPCGYSFGNGAKVKGHEGISDLGLMHLRKTTE